MAAEILVLVGGAGAALTSALFASDSLDLNINTAINNNHGTGYSLVFRSCDLYGIGPGKQVGKLKRTIRAHREGTAGGFSFQVRHAPDRGFARLSIQNLTSDGRKRNPGAGRMCSRRSRSRRRPDAIRQYRDSMEPDSFKVGITDDDRGRQRTSPIRRDDRVPSGRDLSEFERAIRKENARSA